MMYCTTALPRLILPAALLLLACSSPVFAEPPARDYTTQPNQLATAAGPYKIPSGVRAASKAPMYKAWNAWYSDPYRTPWVKGPEAALRMGLIQKMPAPRQTSVAVANGSAKSSAAKTASAKPAPARPKTEAQSITEEWGGGIGKIGASAGETGGGIGKVGPTPSVPEE